MAYRTYVNAVSFEFRFETCVKEELLNIELMRTNYAPKHWRPAGMMVIQNVYHVWV